MLLLCQASLDWTAEGGFPYEMLGCDLKTFFDSACNYGTIIEPPTLADKAHYADIALDALSQR
jgi:hypothetical protein